MNIADICKGLKEGTIDRKTLSKETLKEVNSFFIDLKRKKKQQTKEAFDRRKDAEASLKSGLAELEATETVHGAILKEEFMQKHHNVCEKSAKRTLELSRTWNKGDKSFYIGEVEIETVEGIVAGQKVKVKNETVLSRSITTDQETFVIGLALNGDDENAKFIGRYRKPKVKGQAKGLSKYRHEVYLDIPWDCWAGAESPVTDAEGNAVLDASGQPLVKWSALAENQERFEFAGKQKPAAETQEETTEVEETKVA